MRQPAQLSALLPAEEDGKQEKRPHTTYPIVYLPTPRGANSVASVIGVLTSRHSSEGHYNEVPAFEDSCQR